MKRADGRPVLVTGGAGFIGCNIADRLAGEGEQVVVYDSLARPGVERNLAWLEQRHGAAITPVIADVRDDAAVDRAVAGAKAVFHMAAQVAVTTSFTDPRADFEVNALGTLNVLEAARRRSTPPPVIFASTNKVYGGLEDLDFPLIDGAYQPASEHLRASGIDESRPLDFHTPYGCSKGAADQYVLDYARSFDLPAAVLRMSCIYGQRQMGTEDQGWVAHFLISALEGQPITLYGDGHQVRDILDVQDAVDAYLAVWRQIGRVGGRAFNLGGGPHNAVSLRQILAFIGVHLGKSIVPDFAPWRAGDQRYFVADTGAARTALNLKARKPWRQGVADLARWLAEERAERAGPRLMTASAL
ncbi:CDP-paratose 2-epimerase [Sphingobium sp. 22B]|uniref:SDR family NAD(P)-dependent oxidoreductase n=1 Tax=unclassified Sphingobium TaxID=2611147 RepID=UPI00078230F9|nr:MULTISPECIES: SDR family NAD(P)-dependent oxidoreductase [unclassified Sphingobium]KXU31090.1 CDP-paratose 2-epimerase [Sphingobium sp. AM]KYC33477.1 CDP-paratose 2-epimerase [Sphingobium sp. 22B]OAP32658.1 CDP-paratose 2-epimerase [Sphingobium sp. 20006FA]